MSKPQTSRELWELVMASERASGSQHYYMKLASTAALVEIAASLREGER